jgi:hypothetical protein
MFTKLTELIKAHPWYSLIIAGLIIILLFISANRIGKSIEAYRSNKFDTNQAAHNAEVLHLQVERDRAIARADVAEIKALLKESEANGLRELIKNKGGAIEAAAKETDAKIQEAKVGTGNCVYSVDPTGCVCAKLKALGFECN